MKLVVITPAGRERYMRLLSHYVLGSGDVDEWHLWENCRNDSDRAYLHRLAASDARCRIKRVPEGDGRIDVSGQFYKYCDDPDALYLRLDDDIVFLQEGFFARFKERAMAERGKAFWMAPVIINNAGCNVFLKYFAPVQISGRLSSQPMCPHAWRYPDFVRLLHPVFVRAARAGRIGEFHIPDQTVAYGRFAINAIGFFGEDCVALGDKLVPQWSEADEEEWLSAQLPLLIGKPGKVFGDLVAAHFAFYTQEAALLQTDILESYYDLAGLPRFPYKKPGRPKTKIRHWPREFVRILRNRPRSAFPTSPFSHKVALSDEVL